MLPSVTFLKLTQLCLRSLNGLFVVWWQTLRPMCPNLLNDTDVKTGSEQQNVLIITSWRWSKYLNCLIAANLQSPTICSFPSHCNHFADAHSIQNKNKNRMKQFSFLRVWMLPTFSPCRAGTESRRLWKLSLMWSLRLRSSALWCARLSACNEKSQGLQPGSSAAWVGGQRASSWPSPLTPTQAALLHSVATLLYIHSVLQKGRMIHLNSLRNNSCSHRLNWWKERCSFGNSEITQKTEINVLDDAENK